MGFVYVNMANILGVTVASSTGDSFSETLCKEIYVQRDSLVWGSSKPYIAKSRLNSSVTQWGLGSLDVESMWKSLNFSWLRRFPKSEDIWAIRIKHIFYEIIGHHFLERIFMGPLELLKAVKSCGPHWKKMASSWESTMHKVLPLLGVNEPLNHNGSLNSSSEFFNEGYLTYQ
eukprot:TRINITY_DN1456_c1_g1_i4.p3 TRINITY_DN1456_c1_g1~~TRINITY_DN1456_c1_g1_i4.p3  ORF type:complete len:173 (-),score=1.50 TRINITY_DN1456_c1_g1_i4:903-1421(-)